MKLSKQQVEAIASKIKKQVVDPINHYNSEIRNSKEYINFENTNKDIIALKKLCEKHNVEYHANQIISSIKKEHFKDSFMPLPEFGYNNCTITNDIILGTIEYDNLDELINNLAAKYANA